MEWNALSGFHGHDATAGKWTMQPHLTPQLSSYTKHGSDVYSTCLPNALQHGSRTETGSEVGSSLVRYPSKGWVTATQHIRAVLSFPGDRDEQTTDIPFKVTLHLSAKNAYAYPSSIVTM